MRRFVLSTALIPLSFLIVACATYEPYAGARWTPWPMSTSPPIISSGKGRVWFYRSLPRTTPGFWPIVLLDGKVVAEANPHRVYFADVPPGSHEVSIGSNKVTITVKKQQQIFIKTELEKSGKGFYPTVIDPEKGRKDLAL